MVKCCPNLSYISLVGYEDLSDIVLEFLSGEHLESPGLKLLETLHLPDRSYISEHGVASLLQRLPLLKRLNFPGNLGKVFDLEWEPLFDGNLKLENFSQMMASSSGGVDVSEDPYGFEVQCWTPTAATVAKIRRLCPNISCLRLLIDDLLLTELCSLDNIEDLEAHLTWSGLTAGFELFCEQQAKSLTSIELTLLDNFSWHSIVLIGSACPHLSKFHLGLWREDLTDVAALQLSDNWKDKPVFANLLDLKVKCEVYVDFLPEAVLDFFLLQCHRLQILQYQAPIDWLDHQDLSHLLTTNPLSDLTMLVLSNTSTEPMNLGLETLQLFLDCCPGLLAVGDLKTWRKIDFFNPESEMYFKSESEYSRLRRKAVNMNWDIDFDIENLDNVYKKHTSS